MPHETPNIQNQCSKGSDAPFYTPPRIGHGIRCPISLPDKSLRLASDDYTKRAGRTGVRGRCSNITANIIKHNSKNTTNRRPCADAWKPTSKPHGTPNIQLQYRKGVVPPSHVRPTMDNGLGCPILLPDNCLRLSRLTSTRGSRGRVDTVKRFMFTKL